MAEYLSPGVYVEEYDSGATPMQGVSTSTAGFVGLAERGPILGQPQLVTSFSDYKRTYGGYLSEAAYGGNRFLPYAVEAFFANGGSRAYIMRAVPDDAKAASVTSGALKITAANPGAWAEDLRVVVSPASKAKTQVLAASGAELTLKNADGFNAGDTVELFDGKTSEFASIKSVLDRVVTLDAPCALDVADPKVGTAKYIRTCEITLSVRLGDTEETYEAVSLKPEALNNVKVRTAKSALITVDVLETKSAPAAKENKDKEAPAPKAAGVQVPFALCGGAGDELILSLTGGSNGSVLNMKPGAFTGKDDGPGKRTGLQAFLENANVSIMAIPGITAPEVQAALIGFCESKRAASPCWMFRSSSRRRTRSRSTGICTIPPTPRCTIPGLRCSTPARSAPRISRPPAQWPASMPARTRSAACTRRPPTKWSAAARDFPARITRANRTS
jgi:hypothetical protein